MLIETDCAALYHKAISGQYNGAITGRWSCIKKGVKIGQNIGAELGLFQGNYVIPKQVYITI